MKSVKNSNLKEIFKINSRMANVNTGILTHKYLFTGHDNGQVIAWNAKSLNPKLVCNLIRTVRNMREFKGKLIVGGDSGFLKVISIQNLDEVVSIKKNLGTIWRIVWIDEDHIVYGGKYGSLKFLENSNGVWNSKDLIGHKHSIFGLDCFNSKYLASGDYSGKIIIWEYNNGILNKKQDLDILDGIQGIFWRDENAIAVVSRSGKIHFLEKDKDKWIHTFEINLGTAWGNSVVMAKDENVIYGSTDNEVIQVDLSTYQSKKFEIKNCKKIFIVKDKLMLLTSRGFYVIDKSSIDIPIDLIKFKYSKISLIGHTNVGKSTFCNKVVREPQRKIQTTLGKRIWNWIPKIPLDLECRIVFHDHGGQESVLATFLPFLTDSDLILLFFSQRDIHTFDVAKKALKELKRILTKDIEIVLVQTFIDQPLEEISEKDVLLLMKEFGISYRFKLNPKSGQNVDDLKNYILEYIDWKVARIMIQTRLADDVFKSIIEIYKSDKPNISIDDFKSFFKKYSRKTISTPHLKFILSNLSDQGIIEYYKQISNKIFINDEDLNFLKSHIPIQLKSFGGIININKIYESFPDSKEYIDIIDEIYTTYLIWINAGNLRIFPNHLKEGQIILQQKHKDLLKSGFENELIFNYQEIELNLFLKLLVEKGLNCISVSTNEGLFMWGEDSAIIYYKFLETGDNIKGIFLKCNFYIGGLNEKLLLELKTKFASVLISLLGEVASNSSKSNNVNKKTPIKINEFTYDVAISYSHEEREYVEEVAKFLITEGIDVFFAPFEEATLWGENLLNFFLNVFKDMSKFCIIFISKNYLKNKWSLYEKDCAEIRQLHDNGDVYILPVKFDDTEIPGILSSIGYLNARKKSPEDIVKNFLEKIGYS